MNKPLRMKKIKMLWEAYLKELSFLSRFSWFWGSKTVFENWKHTIFDKSDLSVLQSIKKSIEGTH